MDIVIKEVGRTIPFNLESEISKLKVSIPLIELVKFYKYKYHVVKTLRVDPLSDMVNIEDDQLELIFGPAIDGQFEDNEVPPFYLSLKIHQYILHNTMLDFGASHNLMPRAIMEKLGLDITRLYYDLYSFDSVHVCFLGLIKDLVVSLEQIPAKNVLMDVVVAEILPRFGMLLSRSQGAKLRGTLQLDFSYATIPVFGQMRILYHETKMKYMITNKERPSNNPINDVHIDLESFILCNDSGLNDVDCQLVEIKDVLEISYCIRTVLEKEKENLPTISEQPSEKADESLEHHKESDHKIVSNQSQELQHLEEEDVLWSIEFDRVVGKDGAEIGLWIRSPFQQQSKVLDNVRLCSYKLAFDCTNNEAEYEALITGLKILKKLGARRIAVYGDSELVIKQVKGEYQGNHPRMRQYRNATLDILRMFLEYTLKVVPRIQNLMVDSLATAVSNFRFTMFSNKKFEIHVKHRPTIPDNLQFWQVFWDEKQVNNFLQSEGEFENCSMGEVYDKDDQVTEAYQIDILQLKDNNILKGLIPLEELFDQDDVARKPTLVPTKKGV